MAKPIKAAETIGSRMLFMPAKAVVCVVMVFSFSLSHPTEVMGQLLAGLLACGSSLPTSLPGFPVTVLAGTRRSQLRGQLRFRALMGTPHRIPF